MHADDAGLYLADVQEGDAPALHTIYGDPVTTRLLSFLPKSVEELEVFVATALSEQVEVPRRVYLKLAKLGEEVVGVGRLQHEITWPGGSVDASTCATIGLAIRSDCLRRGYGGRVVDRLLELAWGSRADCDVVWGAVDPDNIASSALLMSRGFQLVDVVPDHVKRRGVSRPSEIYALRRTRAGM